MSDTRTQSGAFDIEEEVVKWELVESGKAGYRYKVGSVLPSVSIDPDTFTFNDIRRQVKPGIETNLELKKVKITKPLSQRWKEFWFNLVYKSRKNTVSKDLSIDKEVAKTLLGEVDDNIEYNEEEIKRKMEEQFVGFIKPVILDNIIDVPLSSLTPEEYKSYDMKANTIAVELLHREKDKEMEMYLKSMGITNEEIIAELISRVKAFKEGINGDIVIVKEHRKKQKKSNTITVEANPYWYIKGRVVDLWGKVREFAIEAPNAHYWVRARIEQWERVYHKFKKISPFYVKFVKTLKVAGTITLFIWLVVSYFLNKALWKVFGMNGNDLLGLNNTTLTYKPVSWFPISFANAIHFWIWLALSLIVLLVAYKLVWKYAKQVSQVIGPSSMDIYIDKVLTRKVKGGDYQIFSIPQYGYDNSLSHTLVWGRTGTGKTATILVPTVVDRAARDGIVFFFDPKRDMASVYPLFQRVYPIDLTDPRGYSIDIFQFLNLKGKVTEQDYLRLAQKISVVSSGEASGDNKFWQESANQRVLLPLMQYANEKIGIPFGWMGILFQVVEEIPELAYALFDKGIADAISGKGDNATDQSILSVATTPIRAMQDANLISLFSYSSLSYETMMKPSTLTVINWDASYQYSASTQLAASLVFYIIDKMVTHRYFEAVAKGLNIKKDLPPVTVVIDELQNLPKIQELATFVTLYRGYGVQIIFSIQSFQGMIADKKYTKEEGLNIISNAPLKVLLPQGAEDEELTKMMNAILAEFLSVNYSVGAMDSASEQKMDLPTEKLISALKRDAAKNFFTPVVIEGAPSHQAVSIVRSKYIPELKSQVEPIARDTYRFPGRRIMNKQALGAIKVEIMSRMGV